MDKELLTTILELARLGAVGIGAIVLLLTFFLLFKSSTFDAGKTKLVSRFMTLGFVFGLAAGLLGLVPLFVASGGPIAMRLNFAPDFGEEKLTPPLIRLPDGKQVKPDERVFLDPSPGTQVVTISIASALKEVKSLRATTDSLAESVAKVTEQRDTLANQVAAASPTPAAGQNLDAQSQQTGQLQAQVVNSLKVGDFVRAREYSSRLHTSVIKTDPTISAISRDRP